MNEQNSEEQKSEEKFIPDWIPSSDGVKEIYSNIVYVNWTEYDVRFRFGQLAADPRVLHPNKAPWGIIEKATLTVPWEQAKYLRDVLTRLIEKYEETNGELKNRLLPK